MTDKDKGDEIESAIGRIHKIWAAKDGEEADENRARYEAALDLLGKPATCDRIIFKRAKNRWPSEVDAFKGFKC